MSFETDSQACEPLQPAEHAKTRGQSPPQSALVLLQVPAGSSRAISEACRLLRPAFNIKAGQ